MVYINFEKAYDRVPIKMIWQALRKNFVYKWYLGISKDMYSWAVTSVKTCFFRSQNAYIKDQQ